MEHAISFIIGTTAIVLGLSLIARPRSWLELTKHLHAQGESASLMIGYLHLIIGTFILGFHWKWSGLSLIVTLIGLKAVLEGVIYTLFPKAMLAMLAWYKPRHIIWFRIGGLLTVIIGGIVLCEWWKYMYPNCTWLSN